MSWNHSQFGGGDDSEKAAFNKLPATHCGYTLREGTERVIKISFLININLIHTIQFNFSNELLVPWSSKPRTNNKEQEKVTEMTLSRGLGPKLTGRSTEDKRAFTLPRGNGRASLRHTVFTQLSAVPSGAWTNTQENCPSETISISNYDLHKKNSFTCNWYLGYWSSESHRNLYLPLFCIPHQNSHLLSA